MIDPMTTATTLPPCPSCGSPDAIRIVYGYPGADMWKAEQRGELRLGGCLVGPESPDFECRGCGMALPWVAEDDDEDEDD
jgi:hypothetical protein